MPLFSLRHSFWEKLSICPWALQNPCLWGLPIPLMDMSRCFKPKLFPLEKNEVRWQRFHLIFPACDLDNKSKLLRETKHYGNPVGWSGRISWTLGRPLKDRWDLERSKEGIQWYHNINKNVAAELAQTIQGIGENLFKLKPTIHWLAVKEKNVGIPWNHQWRPLNVSGYKYAQNLISPLGLAGLFLGGGEFVVSLFFF